MAWENIVVGYSLKDFASTDIIPIGAIYVRSREVTSIWSPNTGQVYKSDTLFTYQVPIYKKKNVKKITK